MKHNLSTNQKLLSEEQIIQKLEIFCAYQERCLADIKKKMKSLGVENVEEQYFIDYLKENNFFNENRFVEKYVQGKLNIKKWGKFKIQQQLNAKQVDKNKISKELASIDDITYFENLYNILEKKNRLLKEENLQKRKQKLIAFAQQKGFEIDLILKALKKLNL